MHERLLAWFDQNRRDLPWRRSRDPWAIWVSEIMLQQTRVEAVRATYERFLARFPKPTDFARASDDELLLAWKGLGYYRRARLLRLGARAVVAEHDGQVPREMTALGDLPGIGEYTRGAIASIAFGMPEIAVDGNVERVVARHRGITTDVRQKPAAQLIRATVRGWQSQARPGDFNQALMELGATVCIPKTPRCPLCPLRSDCEARRRGLTAKLPILTQRKATVAVAARCLVVPVGKDRFLGARIPDGEINAGQVELPTPGVLVNIADDAELAQALVERYGSSFWIGALLGEVRHTITWHRIVLRFYEARCETRRSRAGLVAAGREDPEVPWSTTSRKVFRALYGAHRASKLLGPGPAG